MSLLTDNARECVDASGQSSGSSNVFTVMLVENKPYCLVQSDRCKLPEFRRSVLGIFPDYKQMRCLSEVGQRSHVKEQ